MSKVYYTADWHLGHKAIIHHRPEFKSIEEHNQTLVQNFNKIVKKRDTVYFLGDIAFTYEALMELKELNECRKILVLGNHDTLKAKEYLEIFDDVRGMVSHKNFWLTHCPIHPTEMRRRYGNIHGHLHRAVLPNREKYYDVSPEKHNYSLVGLEEIKEYFKV